MGLLILQKMMIYVKNFKFIMHELTIVSRFLCHHHELIYIAKWISMLVNSIFPLWIWMETTQKFQHARWDFDAVTTAKMTINCLCVHVMHHDESRIGCSLRWKDSPALHKLSSQRSMTWFTFAVWATHPHDRLYGRDGAVREF